MSERSILAGYLENYAQLDDIPELDRRYDYVMAIPAFDESADFIDSLMRSQERDEVLAIVVVNAPEDAASGARQRTRELAAHLGSERNLLLIERIDPPIPRRQGVGLARKLAADLACALIERNQVRCPVIFMTDADAVLPAGYFRAADALRRGTLLYPFRHTSSDPEIDLAGQLYELHLRHYVRGLDKAGSPFAFPTLGSTIAMHADTYARVRGVPRRNTAEDFYLLNKAAKTDPVFCATEPVIQLEARRSERVPFGTGPALRHMPADPDELHSYPMVAFDALGELLQALIEFAVHDKRMNVSEALIRSLDTLDWRSGRFRDRYPPGRQRLRAVMEWFDAFRSMRFIRLQQQAHPPASLLGELRRDLNMPAAQPHTLLNALVNLERSRRCGIGPALDRVMPAS